MPCVELLVALLAQGPAQGPAPALHESVLESGLRIVVARPTGDATNVDAVLSLAVGWGNDATRAGSGLAALMADFATHVAEGAPVWRVELLPTTTLFAGSFPVDGLETALADLAKKLCADNVEVDRWNEVTKERKPPALTTFDRFREAAWPTSRFGAAPPGSASETKSLTRDRLKSFLTQRCGSEGAVLVLVGTAPAAKLELLASRALASLPRARGVVPVESIEPFPARPRRVVAPEGASGRAVGFRLAWGDDPEGDQVALARAWLEALAGRPAAHFEAMPHGALVAFSEDEEAGAARLREVLAGGAELLAGGKPLSPSGFAAALDRVDATINESAATPAGLARLLAEGSAGGDPLLPFERRRRLEAAGAEAAAASLRARIRPGGLIEILARPPPGAASGS